MKQVKPFAKIEEALKLIAEGEYSFTEEGKLFSKAGKEIKGSIGSQDGQRWWNIRSKAVQGQVLAYAVYHGLESLDPAKMIKQLDDNKLNLAKGNLVQVSKKGWKNELEMLRNSNAVVVSTGEIVVSTVDPVEEPTPAPTAEQPQEEVSYTEKELQARNIVKALIAGKTIKEVAEEFGVKPQKIYDIKNGKSSKRATEDLRQAL